MVSVLPGQIAAGPLSVNVALGVALITTVVLEDTALSPAGLYTVTWYEPAALTDIDGVVE